MNKSGNCEVEVLSCTITEKNPTNCLTKISKDRSVSQKIKQRLLNAPIFSIFLNGTERWSLPDQERQKYDRFKM